MTEASKKKAEDVGTSVGSEQNDKPQKLFDSRRSKELVIAFAGPIGCGISQVIEQTTHGLASFGYEVKPIKLSDFIARAIKSGEIKVDSSYKSESDPTDRYLSLQDGGNELRKRGNDILAELAIQEIVLSRAGKATEEDLQDGQKDFVPRRVAYLIDQIKHPEEVSLLRTVYRNLFHLVGVISVEGKRQDRLVVHQRVPRARVSALMERDRKQEEENGQQLDKALQMADFFVRSDRGTVDSLKRQMDRFLDLLHGKNGVTPTQQEYGMYLAYAAGLKSACLSRQVGAAITNTNGEVISTGCNDVPKAGGGLYSREDADNDQRCVHKEDQVCFNDREKGLLREEIKVSLETASNGGGERAIDSKDIDAVLNAVYKASRIKDLIEFSRSVHAEMDAIVSLARTGTPGVRGGILYTTTFPCHSCARHIVAAGISKVYYIEPYEKSLARKLHGDSIAFDTEDEEAKLPHETPQSNPVKFIHFEGVAPRQYLSFFKMTSRKEEGTGRVIRLVPIESAKTVNEYLDNYREFESKVVAHLNDLAPNLVDGKAKTEPDLKPVNT